MSMLSRKKYYCLIQIFLIVIVFLTLLGLADLFLMKRMVSLAHREDNIFHDIGASYVHLHRSLMKLGNIIHFPYWLRETELPVLSININSNDFYYLNSNLPDNVISSMLMPENKVFIKAGFQSGDYSDEIRLRYRGLSNNHWSYSKRSLLAVFPDEHFFNGMKSIDIIIPSDRGYLIEVVNSMRLKRVGLAAPNVYFAWLVINNRNAGVYMIKERFKESWLEKNQIPAESEIFTQDVLINENMPYLEYLSGQWTNWRRNVHEEDDLFEELETFFSLLRDADDITLEENIGRIVDLDKWYKSIAVTVLSGNVHGIGGANANLIFNSALGQFEHLMEDIDISSAERYPGVEIYEQITDLLSGYILSSPALYQDYLEVLKDLSSEENMIADLENYDLLTERILPELYKDQIKLQNDYHISKKIKTTRDYIIENYKRAQELTKITEPPLDNERKIMNNRPKLTGSYQYLYEVTLSLTDFVNKHPQFSLRDNNLILFPGVYYITDNIIIPSNSKLIIYPGTTLKFAPKVSLISYSQIEVLGEASSPVVFEPIDDNQPWGVLGVINLTEKSILRNVIMKGGSSSDKINGVIFTGMFSAHQAPVEIINSTFIGDRDDDAVNIKYATGKIVNSRFADTNGDAIDLDMTNSFIIEGNDFSNIGLGEDSDAIDLSFSNAQIKGNIINGCKDKGISVGEKSEPIIENNLISDCDIGIAVKDYSIAVIRDNKLNQNRIGLSVYQKKQVFGGAVARLVNNTFFNNEEDFNKDEFSDIYWIVEN